MTEVETRVAQGLLVGRRADGVDRYFGVPFAAPPVGERRWAAPQPPSPWTGRRPALAFGPDSPQPPFEGWGQSRAARMDEDCLYLNVWAPAGADGAPVLVVVHGGGFQLMSGAHPIFDGETLASAGIVVVTFNYRLGVLGFAGGSNWLLDQIAALRWVRDNIAAFGGAPDRVTVLGMSAGGVSVNALNIAPAAAGLFSQAVSISGGGDTLFTSGDHPPLPPASAGDPPVHASAFSAGAGEMPVVDGARIPGFPTRVLAAGGAHARRLIVAFSTFEAIILDLMGLPADAMAAALAPGAALAADDPAARDGHALYDHLVFRQPALDVADAAAGAGIETYVLDYGFVLAAARPHLRGSPHGAAMFDTLGTRDPTYATLNAEPTPQDLAVAASLRRRLLGFLRGEAPDDGPLAWPRHRPGAPDALRVAADGRESVGRPLDLHELAALGRRTEPRGQAGTIR
ncbi:carboxylesterase family protein [Phenylobacterium sp.]|uniref:carboxylesterase family protein n=1 Tax=Phenylobacterium sp. TaxID=1871053 RepID=UPI00301CAD09